METPSRCGVWALLNTVTGQVYVAASVDVPTRAAQYQAALARGQHWNQALQAAWTAHPGAFAVGVLTWCTPAALSEQEAVWVAALAATEARAGYNHPPGRRRGPKVGKRGYSLQEVDYTITYAQEYVKCGKPECTRCAAGPGHGPYWYSYHYSPTLKRRIKTYIGKTR